MIGAWWGLVPTIVAMLIVAVLPGYFAVRPWVRSSVIAVAVAPSISLAVITILSVLFDKADVPWEKEKVFPVLGVLAAIGAVAWLFVSATRAGGGRLPRGGIVAAIGPRQPIGMAQARIRAATWLMIAAGALAAATPMVFFSHPDDPVQQWDSTFHLNGVWSILYDHSASPFGGLSALYHGREVFYPTGWHAFTALFAEPTTVIRAANASSVAMMIIWVVGATALTSVVTRHRTAILAAPLLAGTLLSMPADALTMYNQWPNALGLVLVPGVAALSVVTGRRFVTSWGRGVRAQFAHAPLVVALGAGAIGIAGSHPSSLFTLVAILAAPALVSLKRLAERDFNEGRFLSGLVAAVLTFLVIALPFAALTTGKIRAMGRYPRAGLDWSSALGHMFTPYPPFTPTSSMGLLLLVQTLLLVFGVFAVAGVWRSAPRSPGAFDARRARAEGEVAAGENRPEGPDAQAHSSSSDQGAVASDVESGDATVPGSNDGDAGPEERDGLVPDASSWIGAPSATESPSAPVPPPSPISSYASAAPTPTRDRSPYVMWPLASYLVFCVLTGLAFAPLGPIRTFLLAPWYLDSRRIMGAHGLVMVPLMAIGFTELFGAFHRRIERIISPDGHARIPRWCTDAIAAVLLLFVTGVGALDARVAAVDYVYDADHLGKPGMATTNELQMLRRMPFTLPDGALVLGDPIAGAAYVEVIGQHSAVFPQLTMTNGTERWQSVLAHHFNEIHTNPEVCEVVRELGITHFYEDADGRYYNFMRSDRSPGLYNVDTSTGFELVDTGDEAKLYKITACGEVEGRGITPMK